ncbi:hypothetical protein AB0467_26390 [Streptomyces sp. NPDC052095]|uniref:hypothetical protein n=1 Tax=unclassified Streptomyces TaxID=2593676 RepID=UPI00344D7FA5
MAVHIRASSLWGLITGGAGNEVFNLAMHVLRDPARLVPSYGFDAVPVLVQTLRAGRQQLLRRLTVVALLGLLAVFWDPIPAVAALAGIALSRFRPVGPLLWVAWAYFFVPLAWDPGRWASLLFSGPDTTGLLERLLAARTPLLTFVPVLALVYVVDAVTARWAHARAGRSDDTWHRLPFGSPGARRQVKQAGLLQNSDILPYDDRGQFIGAGRETLGGAGVRIPLRPGRPAEPVVTLRETELLAGIEAAMSADGPSTNRSGALTETAPLPGFSVTRVIALPVGQWLAYRRARARMPGPASGPDRPERQYLRVQCVSWEGQLVVSLFVHAALQAGELRLTLLTQATTPLPPLPMPRHTAVSEGLSRVFGQHSRPGRNIFPGPLSLRDAFSLPGITDMHQRSDAERHTELMQTAVLSAVKELLGSRGFATDAVSDPSTVINNIQVLGNNSGYIQLTGGLTLTNVAQSAAHVAPVAPGIPTVSVAPVDPPAVPGASVPPRSPALPAPSVSPVLPAAPVPTTQGVPMSPVFPRRDPSSEPAHTPGSGISIGGDNNGTAQNAVGHRLSHVTQTGAGQGGGTLESVASLLASFRTDIDRHADLLTDLENLRVQTMTLTGALTEPQGEGFRPALSAAVRSLPALVAGTAVQQSGEALVSAIRELLG